MRHTALPRPGDERQLKRLAARIMSQHLDRSKPLWEIWVVEGLEGGDRFAMISKIHHCMVDGVSSVDLLNVLLTARRRPTSFEPAPTGSRGRRRRRCELLRGRRASAYATLPLELGRRRCSTLAREATRPSLGHPRSAARRCATRSAAACASPSTTPLNQPIGPHRRFDWLAMDLADVKAVKNRLGGTVNDVVLATVAGAVRALPRAPARATSTTLDFRVMAPVSVRTEARARHARQPRLGVDGADAARRARPAPAAREDPRDHRAPEGIEAGARRRGADGRSASGRRRRCCRSAAQLATRALPFNLVVTNVPGPQVPLYLLGARMLDNYGLVPLTRQPVPRHRALQLRRESSAGASPRDWDLLPDLHDFVLDVEASFRELADLDPAVAKERSDGKRPRRTASRAAASPPG